jgi:hypothetical protein
VATPFVDTFDGAGATTALDAWTPTGGTSWTRQDGTATAVNVRTTGGIAPGGTTASYICDDQGSSSQYIIFQAPTTAGAVINGCFSALRLVAHSDLIGVRFTGTGSTGVQLGKIVGSTITTIQSSQFTASEWIKIEVDGSAGAAKVRLYGGGTGGSPGSWTLVGTEQTVSDAVFDGETSIGVRSSSANASNLFALYFQAGPLGGAATSISLARAFPRAILNF